MTVSDILLPGYYGSIRETVLDFTKTLFPAGHMAVFKDKNIKGETGKLPAFALTVFKDDSDEAEVLFKLTYAKGDLIIKVKSAKKIKSFKNGVLLSDGYLAETLALLLRNATK